VAGKKQNEIETKEKFCRDAVTHLDHLYRVAFHLASSGEAQDLVQETYARAISAYQQFNPGSNMKAWLTRILYNLFFDRHHEKKRWVAVEGGSASATEALDYAETIPTGNPGPEGYALLKERNAKISDALRKLPEEFRAAIILVDMDDFSYAEAAEVLACPIGTIRSRISRGRQLMHKLLKGYVGTKSPAKRRENW
jgi:RNA polymerase sigma-70 factor, ECF subfamily